MLGLSATSGRVSQTNLALRGPVVGGVFVDRNSQRVFIPLGGQVEQIININRILQVGGQLAANYIAGDNVQGYYLRAGGHIELAPHRNWRLRGEVVVEDTAYRSMTPAGAVSPTPPAVDVHRTGVTGTGSIGLVF